MPTYKPANELQVDRKPYKLPDLIVRYKHLVHTHLLSAYCGDSCKFDNVYSSIGFTVILSSGVHAGYIKLLAANGYYVRRLVRNSLGIRLYFEMDH